MTSENEYAGAVDTIRIFDEGDGWAIDGFNAVTEKYTEKVWKFDTSEEARKTVLGYVEELRTDGIAVSDVYSLELTAD